jgi:dTDP-4-amino-4,6-dideoxy-D-glucose transaminase
MSSGPHYVARPIVPKPDDFLELLKVAFATRRLSNGGPLNNMLQLRLAELLRAPFVSLVSNGTVAIEVAARALNMKGPVVTTPFTFPATVSALLWIGLNPVLVDIEEDYLTISAQCIEAALTEEVTGIVGVHVYGNPCDIVGIQRVADRAKIPVLYDGAHAFDGLYCDEPIVLAGDATTLSFHATKLFNTAEGGAVVTRRNDVNERIALLRNFGIASEDNIIDVGINAKMSEINAAFGLANLNLLTEERHQRELVVSTYKEIFEDHRLVKVVPRRPQSISPNQYFAIRFPGSETTRLRDRVYEQLRTKGIYARRYFYPLLSEVPAIRAHLRQTSFSFPNATRAAAEVLVLPLHGGIDCEDAAMIGHAVIEAVNA